MSTRTVIEINHDYLHDLMDSPHDLTLFLHAFGFASVDELKEKQPPGIRVLGQRHHSEELTIKVR